MGKWHLGFFKSEYTPTFRGIGLLGSNDPVSYFKRTDVEGLPWASEGVAYRISKGL